jgi:glycosyltransferase involved in cell wall biosynthesis
MRILHLYHGFGRRGGAERHILDLAYELEARGHSVSIVSADYSCPNGAPRVSFTAGGMPAGAISLYKWFREFPPDIVHAHSRRPALLASIMRPMLGIPIVVTSHTIPASMALLSCWGERTIAVSHAVARSLQERFGVHPSRVVVVRNGIRDTSIEPSRDETLAGLPWPRVAFVARFDPGKRHADFLACAARLVAEGFPGSFVLAGDGPLLAEYVRRYQSARVVFCGYYDNVLGLLASATASVICSESEGFPYVALESLWVGTPVLASDCGGTREIISQPGDGQLFPVGDRERLCNMLRRVASGKLVFDARAEIASRARSRFSGQRMAEQVLSVYEEVLHA